MKIATMSVLLLAAASARSLRSTNTSMMQTDIAVGPFDTAVDACNECFKSYTKEGEAPAGPVSPFCVCVSYPKNSKHTMFCSSMPSVMSYTKDQDGCRCQARDMEAMGKTTCKTIQ